MKHVGLIGAGAVGSYFIDGMIDHEEIDFFLIANGERKARLEKGIYINRKLYQPVVKSPEEVEEMDLLLLATKYSGLFSAIEMMKVASKENTVILSLLNGVDSEEKIKEAGVKGTVLYSVMRIAGKHDDLGVAFVRENTQGVYFGAVSEEEQAVVKEVCDIFEMTPIRYTVVEDILADMWLKYASNIANNLPQAVLGTDASIYYDSEHGLHIATKLWDEVRAVAKTKGVELQEEPFLFTVVPKTSKFSTAQDIMAGRHTEIDMFAGHLIKLASEQGIPVPYTEYTYHAIKVLEEKNDGIVGC